MYTFKNQNIHSYKHMQTEVDVLLTTYLLSLNVVLCFGLYHYTCMHRKVWYEEKYQTFINKDMNVTCNNNHWNILRNTEKETFQETLTKKKKKSIISNNQIRTFNKLDLVKKKKKRRTFIMYRSFRRPG